MSFDAAIVKEQGVTFVVIAVEQYAGNSSLVREQAFTAGMAHFPGIPVVLMVQDGRGRPTYWGRRDIVNFLARVRVAALPWRRFN